MYLFLFINYTVLVEVNDNLHTPELLYSEICFYNDMLYSDTA